jgi:hypothetical protein
MKDSLKHVELDKCLCKCYMHDPENVYVNVTHMSIILTTALNMLSWKNVYVNVTHMHII